MFFVRFKGNRGYFVAVWKAIYLFLKAFLAETDTFLIYKHGINYQIDNLVTHKQDVVLMFVCDLNLYG